MYICQLQAVSAALQENTMQYVLSMPLALLDQVRVLNICS